ncbi:succinate dehydrogenase assembly factor 2 [Ampullimonas aquatilis]|uniref:FAD assembly factor SdhE n=1 Tax=Ampullimonas aquatilis TaxID=1341549 RepID=UPI003C75D182
MPSHQSDPLNRARLRWRARRGLLENDVILTRFLDEHESELSDDEVGALSALLDLSDNELLDLLLSRKEPDDSLQTQSVLLVLNRLRAV